MTDSATGSLNSVVFWETKTFLRRKSAQPFPKGCQLASLSWASNNSKLAVVPKWGDRIAICDFHDDIMTWSFLLHKEGGSFTCGNLLHSSRYLVSGCGNSEVLIWDLKNKNIIKTFQGHDSAVSSIANSSNDHLVVSGSQSGTILMHTVSSSTAQQMVNLTKDQPLKQMVNRLNFSHMERSHLGSVSEDGVVCLWSVESQRMLAKFTPSHTSAATDVCFSPSNNMLMISVGMDAKIKCYDIQTRKTVTEVTAPAALSSVALLKDGFTLIGGGADGKLYVYELRSVKTPREVIEAHQSAVTCITLQHSTKSAGRRSSAKGSASRSKEHSSPPSKDPSVLVSSPEKSSTTKDELCMTTTPSTIIAAATPASTSASSSSVGSHDTRTQPHVQGQTGRGQVEDAPVISRSGHIQSSAMPETVTPFVTTQHPGGTLVGGGGGGIGKKELTVAGLDIHTPLGVSSKQQNKNSGGLPYDIATPANMQAHTSSIFSPIDSQLVTPLNKVTAAVAPTLRTTPLDSTHSTMPLSGAPAPSINSTRMTNTQFAAGGGGGIFSPLDSGLQSRSHSSFFSRPSIATPGGVGTAREKLDTSLNLSAMGPPPSLPASSRFASLHTQERLTSQSTPAQIQSASTQPLSTHPLEIRQSVGGVTEQREVDETEIGSTSQLEQERVGGDDSARSHTQLPPSQPPPDHLEDKTTSKSLPISSSQPTHTTLAEQQLPPLHQRDHPLTSSSSAPVLHGPVAVAEGNAATAAAASGVPPVPGIQMKFVENLIKDSQEELWYSVHRDIRALSVDMFRQFFAMQQQSAAQYTALNEKVERLTEENKRLQEMVYQYMPKH